MQKKFIYSLALCVSLFVAMDVEAETISTNNVSFSTKAVAVDAVYSGVAKSEQELKLEMTNMLKAYAPTGKISYVGDINKLNSLLNQLIEEIKIEEPYVEGTLGEIQINGSSIGSNITITFTNQYLTTAAQEKYVNEQIPKIIAEIIKPDMTQLQKVKAINDYIVQKTTYSVDTKASPHVPYTILTESKGVCQAYALLTLRLLQEVNIESRYVTGFAGNEPHAWNMVKLDGAWYHLDTTWNDPTFQDNLTAFKDHIGYEYFLVSDAQMFKDHVMDDRGYPVATSTKYDAFYEISTYIYSTSMSLTREPYFGKNKIYAFKNGSGSIDYSIYEANVNDAKLQFNKISNIQAYTFVATDESIYYVAYANQQLIKYNIQLKQEKIASNKKVTELYVEGDVLIAKSGTEIVYRENIASKNLAIIAEIEVLADKLAVVDAQFETNYATLKKLVAQVSSMDLSATLQNQLANIDTLYNRVRSISSYSAWSTPKVITNANKPWTVKLSSAVKSSESNFTKIKVVDIMQKELQVGIKIDGQSITVTPSQSYVPNTPYFLIIEKGLESMDGKLTTKGVQQRFIFEQ